MKNEKQQILILPFDRKQLFAQTVRRDYPFVLFISLVISIFAAPFIIFAFMSITELSTLSSQYVAATNADVKNQLLTQLVEARQTMYLIFVPTTAILSVGASGCFYLAKQYIWTKSVVLFKDWAIGVKQNAVKFITFTFIFSMFNCALNYCFSYITLNTPLKDYSAYLQVVQIVVMAIAFSMLMFQYCAVVVYRASFVEIFKNSLVLSFGTFFRSIGMLLLCFAPILLLVVLWKLVVVYILAVTFLALFGFGAIVLCMTLHCQYVFDKYINEKKFPEIYRKGLFVENK